MRIDLLDMGTKKYGDCVVVTHGGRTILIDGAHRGNSNNVRAQLKTVLGHNPPFAVDLLVITHCHDDHIGQLPTLVEDGELTAQFVLAADEKFGWGRDVGGNSPVDSKGLTGAQRAVVSALLEEDRSDLPPAELEQFIQDAGTLEQRYGEMLEALEGQGATVVRYGRDPAAKVQEIETAFADFGLKVLGPTRNHIIRCAEAIAQASDGFADAVAAADPAADAGPADLVRTYQRLARRASDAATADAEFAADQPGVGAAKNDQSIVLKVAAGGWTAMLAGDMQFAKAEVPGLTPMMTALRQTVVDAGPYDFIKLTHHTSYNAVNAAVLDEYSTTKLFAHTGGLFDPGHPDDGVLELLESRQDDLTFARTDRNGRITVEMQNGEVVMTPSKGQLNNFAVNSPPDEPVAPTPRELGTPPRPTTPAASAGAGNDVVEVVARVPHKATKVTITIQVEPDGQVTPVGVAAVPPATVPPAPAGEAEDVRALRVGGGRALPRLLFVTSRPRLESNIGRQEAGRVFAALAAARNVTVVDLPAGSGSAEQAAGAVRARLSGGDFAGVVLLGGYDVVPPHRLDVLDAAARRAVADAGQDGDDADDFVVWSDELYGDRDGDYMPEVPVSRIPDGRRADVVFAALTAPKFSPRGRFGVRNLHRPFAGAVFPGIPGRGERLEVSEVFAPEHVTAGAAVGAVYYMLHGAAGDATRFWGETQGGAAFEAVAVQNVPTDAAGSVVFTGCCWGALAASPPAARARPDTLLRPRGPEASMAVAYLRAGAVAFVGCTGSHYSPLAAPYDYFGKPMHDAFWAAVALGRPPAEALFLAKTEFARRMPHGRTDPFSRAVEVKILRQFTCLGLGW